MACRLLFACAGFLLASIFLTGCGGGKQPSTTSKVSILVMRHCIRSTPEKGIYDIKGLDYYNNYSSPSWPPFKAPAYYCLSRGADIVKGTGKWLKQHGDLPKPFHVVADDCERDNVTATALLSGLTDDETTSFVTDRGPFHATSSCPWLSGDEIGKAVAAQNNSVPKPDPALLGRLASILQAKGDAANWNASGCTFNPQSGYLDGSCSAASDFVERFIMEWGGGMEVAWKRLNVSELPHLLQLHSWYRMMQDSAPEVVAREQASIMVAVSSALKNIGGSAGATGIFVGHDTQLNALIGGLGLTWSPDPFPVNATLPGSFVRFDSDGTTVTMSYVFPSNFSDDGDAMGSMTSVPAKLVATGKNTIGLEELEILLGKGSVAACAQNWTFDDQSYDRLKHGKPYSDDSLVV